MATGTTLIDVKQALLALLVARPTLTATATYDHPGQPALTGNDVWLADVPAATTTIPTMRAGKKHVEETFTLQLMVQAVRSAGEGQLVADLAAAAHFREVQQLLAENPQLGLPTTIQHALLVGWAHRTGGFIDGGESARGSRFELSVQVKARLV